MISDALRQALSAKLTAEIVDAAPLSGGDINAAYRLKLSNGERFFLKTNASAPAHMFSAEAKGLSWLRQAGALQVPEVIAHSDPNEPGPKFLVLEYVERGRTGSDYDETLGRGLADLHRSGAVTFGLDYDNFIGSLPQLNAASKSWADFYWNQRLEPMLERAAKSGMLPTRLRSDFTHLRERLPVLVGPPEPPARLHGDLWSGNVFADAQGKPCLIDPAVYGGHREMDLAMMQLFGGFSSQCFAAYNEAYPLAAGHEQRIALYQLYPLLVHVNLFGRGYISAVERNISRLLV